MQFLTVAALLLTAVSAAPAPGPATSDSEVSVRYLLQDCEGRSSQWSQISYFKNPTSESAYNPDETGIFKNRSGSPTRVTWEDTRSGFGNSVFTRTQQIISFIDREGNRKRIGEQAGTLAASDNHGGPQFRVYCYKDNERTRITLDRDGNLCVSKYYCQY